MFAKYDADGDSGLNLSEQGRMQRDLEDQKVTKPLCIITSVWLGGLVVSALGMRTRRPRFESRVAPLFHWVATLGKLFTHITSPVSQLQETGVQKGVFDA